MRGVGRDYGPPLFGRNSTRRNATNFPTRMTCGAPFLSTRCEYKVRHPVAGAFSNCTSMRQEGQSSEALVGLGHARLETGDADPARRHFEEALTASSSNADAHAGLGLALFYEGSFEAAGKACDQALAVDPYCLSARSSTPQFWRRRIGMRPPPRHARTCSAVIPRHSSPTPSGVSAQQHAIPHQDSGRRPKRGRPEAGDGSRAELHVCR